MGDPGCVLIYIFLLNNSRSIIRVRTSKHNATGLDSGSQDVIAKIVHRVVSPHRIIQQ
jgi:hypothetical protein